ncbi:hypothetical protein DFH08DRAFT_847529 [Mycena albidolilacea]|uniref:Uncharacterized protein n=1 Tax=Mycena albidolilacea TaxID=1033008 RepID=A0AAD7F0C3_9AGAR|nr:hypothetical protein DFH08DRAFT_847529 [Mycena albidolilacea]
MFLCSRPRMGRPLPICTVTAPRTLPSLRARLSQKSLRDVYPLLCLTHRIAAEDGGGCCVGHMPAELKGVEIYVCWTQQGVTRAGSAHATRARLVFIAIASLFAVHGEDEMWAVWMRRARGRLVPQTFPLVLDFHVAERCGKWDPGGRFFPLFFCAGIRRRRGELREGGGGMRSGTASRRDGVAFARTGYWLLDAGYPNRDQNAALRRASLFDARLSLFLFDTALHPPFLLGPGPLSRLPPVQSETVGWGGGWMEGEGGMHRRVGGSRWKRW